MFKYSVLRIMAKSPFKDMQKHMSECCGAANLLPNFFAAIIAQDWDGAAATHKEISVFESRADSVKLAICHNLHKGIFLPVSKNQVLDLVMIQDSIANISEDISGLVFGRKMSFPPAINDKLLLYVDSAVNACGKAFDAINQLSQMVESGFSGSVQELTEEIIAEVNKIESKNDKIQIDLREILYNIERDLDPLDAMFFYKTIDNIGRLADAAQKVGVQLIMLVAK